ncbi:carbohydrate kinase family protein [Candidatus Nomurabacteria bacterium]|nr:carbohydrate kinase family protein [Candidatus Nomurabacteria bacterium]
METNKHIQFLAIGDMVTDAFIELKDAVVHCNINNTDCELCVKFGAKVPYESVTEIRAVGNSANAACAAARLGLISGLVSATGDDRFGEEARDTLKNEKVVTNFIYKDTRYPTNYHYVLRYGAERTILIKHAPFKYALPTSDTEVDWLYFSSIGEHALDFHHEVVNWFTNRPNTKLAFQPGTFQIKVGTEVLKDIYAKTEIFFCNKEEAQIILKSEEKDIKKLAKNMHTLGPKKVVITDGPNGLTASDGTSIYSLPMYPDIKDPVDRTGAGDATSSTIVAMLALGIEFKDALLYGPINSMSVVQYIGAQAGLLSREKIEEYLHNAPESYKIS